MIDVKGLKAQGNQLTKLKVKAITLLPPEEGEEWGEEVTEEGVSVEGSEDIVVEDTVVVAQQDEGPLEVEWEVTGANEEEQAKKGSKGAIKDSDDEDEDQMSLF